MKFLKCNKGLTLVELVITMVICAVIMTTVAAIFPTVLRSYEQANSLAERNTLLNNLANQITADLSDLSKQVSEENLGVKNRLSFTTGQGEIVYGVEGGVLLKNGSEVFSKDYYKNKSVEFLCVAEKGGSVTAYTLTVTITADKGGESISRDYAVTPLVLNQY